MRSKLIIVEGIPGSGKSTTARYIKGLLEEKGLPVRFFQEGDTKHPADYESVACLTEDEFYSIIKKYMGDRELLYKYTEKKDQLYFIHYYDLVHENPTKDTIAQDLSTYDVYEREIHRFEKVGLNYWKSFVEKSQHEEVIYIFECCFIQNPFTKFIAKENAGLSRVRNYVHKISEEIKPLHPLLIYLHQEHVGVSFGRVYAERSQEWKDFFTRYHTQNGYGKAHDLQGFDGLVRFLEMRRNEELKIIQELGLEKLLIKTDKQNWDHYYQEIHSWV